ncbi:hypothetical protein ACJJTC_016370 [Scirpophaga incertulas]
MFEEQLQPCLECNQLEKGVEESMPECGAGDQVELAAKPLAVMVAARGHHVAELVRYCRRARTVPAGDPETWRNIALGDFLTNKFVNYNNKNMFVSVVSSSAIGHCATFAPSSDHRQSGGRAREPTWRNAVRPLSPVTQPSFSAAGRLRAKN